MCYDRQLILLFHYCPACLNKCLKSVTTGRMHRNIYVAIPGFFSDVCLNVTGEAFQGADRYILMENRNENTKA